MWAFSLLVDDSNHAHTEKVNFRSLSALVAGIVCFSLAGCRFSFDLLADDHESLGGGAGYRALGGASPRGDGDGGTTTTGGTTATGGAVSSGGGSSTGGLDGSGGVGATGGTEGLVTGDLVVDIAEDEDDVGASATAPLGMGLSLREAIKIANADGGSLSISVTPGIAIAPASDLPEIDANVQIYGNGVSLDFSSLKSSRECILVVGGTSLITNVQVKNCSQEPLFFAGGSEHQVSNSFFENNAKSITDSPSTGGTIFGPGNTIVGGVTHAVFVNSPDDVVIDNTFTDVGGSGNAAVFVGGSGVDAKIIGNLMMRAQIGIALSSTTQRTAIWHNTIVSSGGTGIVVGQASDIDVRNNIVSHSGLYGIAAASDKFTYFDYNLFFNTMDCNGCIDGLGSNSLIADPLYESFAEDNFALSTAGPSPAINAGTSELMLDRNQDGAGTYFGSAPDMGFSESN